jgi:hypothetical protein
MQVTLKRQGLASTPISTSVSEGHSTTSIYRLMVYGRWWEPALLSSMGPNLVIKEFSL